MTNTQSKPRYQIILNEDDEGSIFADSLREAVFAVAARVDADQDNVIRAYDHQSKKSRIIFDWVRGAE